LGLNATLKRSRTLKRLEALAPGACLLLLAALPLQAATTLTRIRQTKTLRCGINHEIPEYSTSDDHGPRIAFDADICRAVAIAILGPSARTTLTPYPDDVAASAALRAHRIDLIPTQTLDLTHASNSALTFSPPLLYDGVGFLVPLTANFTRAANLTGKKICFLAATQVELALQSWFAREHLDLLPFPFQEEGEMQAAFVSGNCTALAGDLTRLAGTRAAFGPLAARYTLLPDQISSDPLAAASRSDDPAFAAIVQWTVEALLNAEAAGLTQQAASTLLQSSKEVSSRPNPEQAQRAEGEVERPAVSPTTLDPTLAILTGQTREIGTRLGLDNAWALQVIAALGNYAEIYDRDLGDQSPLKLPRAQNRLNTQGGLMLPLPLK
jgi:general L-amino acid transport system substrate-binding protein